VPVHTEYYSQLRKYIEASERAENDRNLPMPSPPVFPSGIQVRAGNRRKSRAQKNPGQTYGEQFSGRRRVPDSHLSEVTKGLNPEKEGWEEEHGGEEDAH